ncbi:MAG: hypothetical protein LUH54_02985 [Firmicutes bacterium]|nr:hypothetical protein [Bacillota bacterium]
MPILYCTRCRKAYIHDSKKVAALLRDNFFARSFLLDNKQLWDETYRKERQKKLQLRRLKQEEKARLRELENKFFLEKLSSIESSTLLIQVCYNDVDESEVCEYIIIKDKKMSSRKDRILHYSSNEARELLTAAFHKSREGKKSILSGRAFFVKRVFPDDNHYGGLSDRIPNVVLEIKNGGGHYSSTQGVDSCEIVDLLLYSPFTKRFEIICATLNIDVEYCYTDISRYREFVNRYGKPDVDPNLGQYTKRNNLWYPMSFDNLNTESFLRAYGYNVSAAYNISTMSRQKMLAEIMDLELFPQGKIISFLDWLIRTRTQERYEIALSKWIEDKKFVENYRLNPKRFMIAK